MATIISVCLKSKSLLRKEIYGDFEKTSETPQKWRQINMKSLSLEAVWSRTLYKEIIVPLLDKQ